MMRMLALFLAAFIILQPVSSSAQEAAAVESPAPTATAEAPVVPADPLAVTTTASNMLLMDATTGTVLAEYKSGERMFPSSMSKLMTLYVLFEELKRGTLQLTDTFTVSENAWRIQGSKMFVPIGEQVPVEDLLRGIAIQSGNDACVVIAEGLAGSEAAFADRLNAKAKELGMTGSHFVNSSGWPDENHYVTASDLAILAHRLAVDFPEYYHYFAEREFTYHNIRQYNRNPLLGKLGVDGLKTGHTEAAGYGIVISAKEPVTERRLVLVVNGLESMDAREQESEHLLTWGFRNFENVKVAEPGQVIAEANVFMGKADKVGLTVAEPLTITLPKVNRDKVSVKAHYEGPLTAPIEAGKEVGTLIVALPNGAEKQVPLVAANAVAKKGVFARIPATIGSWF